MGLFASVASALCSLPAAGGDGAAGDLSMAGLSKERPREVGRIGTTLRRKREREREMFDKEMKDFKS